MSKLWSSKSRRESENSLSGLCGVTENSNSNRPPHCSITMGSLQNGPVGFEMFIRLYHPVGNYLCLQYGDVVYTPKYKWLNHLYFEFRNMSHSIIFILLSKELYQFGGKFPGYKNLRLNFLFFIWSSGDSHQSNHWDFERLSRVSNLWQIIPSYSP